MIQAVAQAYHSMTPLGRFFTWFFRMGGEAADARDRFKRHADFRHDQRDLQQSIQLQAAVNQQMNHADAADLVEAHRRLDEAQRQYRASLTLRANEIETEVRGDCFDAGA